MQSSFHGYIASIQDAHLLICAAQQGLIPVVNHRLSTPERKALIRSGSVFVFTASQSGIKRWTDGHVWSPSRIMDEFLLYRELVLPFAPGAKRKVQHSQRCRLPIPTTTIEIGNRTSFHREPLRQLTGSLISGYAFKKHGLFKKSTSRTGPNNEGWHLVSYYLLEDVQAGRLLTPRQLMLQSSSLLTSLSDRPSWMGTADKQSRVIRSRDLPSLESEDRDERSTIHGQIVMPHLQMWPHQQAW